MKNKKMAFALGALLLLAFPATGLAAETGEAAYVPKPVNMRVEDTDCQVDCLLIDGFNYARLDSLNGKGLGYLGVTEPIPSNRPPEADNMLVPGVILREVQLLGMSAPVQAVYVGEEPYVKLRDLAPLGIRVDYAEGRPVLQRDASLRDQAQGFVETDLTGLELQLDMDPTMMYTDAKAQYLAPLTQALAARLPGFDPQTFVLTSAEESTREGSTVWSVRYAETLYGSLSTGRSVVVEIVNGTPITCRHNLDKEVPEVAEERVTALLAQTQAAKDLAAQWTISRSENELAVAGQSVTPLLDEDGAPYLSVSTTFRFVEETGKFVSTFHYYLPETEN